MAKTMTKLDLTKLSGDVTTQMEKEFLEASITPRGTDAHYREYVSFDTTALGAKLAALRTEFGAALAAKRAECADDKTFSHMGAFGADHKTHLQKIANSLESDIARLDVFQRGLDSMINPANAIAFVEVYNNGRSTVTRYGIDLVSAKGYVATFGMLYTPAASGVVGVAANKYKS